MHSAGTLLDGRFRVLSVLGAGSQGVVVRAEDPEGRAVAVKVLPEGAPEERLHAALAEARLLASLEHPNLVTVREALRIGDRACVVMELVEGPSLAQVLARHRRLSPADAVPLFRQIAAALSCAHGAGVVHRDVKPANVLLASSPGDGVVVKLVDFGVAAPRGREGRASDLVGTPVYMAPEQAVGGAADPRADLYALGVLMFRTLTGFRPFPGDDAISAAVNHLTQPVPTFDDVVPELLIPPDLEDVVRRCLEKDPARRYPDADALIADLDALRLDELYDEATLDEAPASPHPPIVASQRAPWRWLWPVGMGAVLGALLRVLG